ncbi:RadC family protein [Bdellovibrio sp. NC01]|uniref:JAB domain-containing protein n=1 Tax=Bdellovibrio sp. NC01 TaxID=2220073 RepID=UPI0011571880|nr:JAB domain-containing protein [Bdellovibrio sp. NC01]QDK36267.1 DNA repair protein [Bdellovibrio sp. NC01]
MTNEVNSSAQAFALLQPHFNSFSEEVWVIALNSHLQVIGLEMIFRGTVDQCLIHPRDIFRYLISRNASSFILAHNHPSSEILPSDQDLILTRKIYSAGVLLQIPMQDHVIFSNEKYFSMADHGHFKTWKKKLRANSYY